MKQISKRFVIFIIPIAAVISCNDRSSAPSKELISALDLRRGEVISCGSPDKEFGTVNFPVSGSDKLKSKFNVAVELLHSFEYDEAEKLFAKIIDEYPDCAMAYWGVAMCSFHPLWEPPSEVDLMKGSRAVEIANSLSTKTEFEADFIHAAAAYYKDWNGTDPHTRCVHFKDAMEKLHHDYPNNAEAAIFYALSLDAAARPTDKTYEYQKMAGAILDSLYAREPDHPGIIHYIIHTYDYPGLASIALPAARRYAIVAPSSSHAQHMPSHIFTRLGLWDESVTSNLHSVSSAKCYAESAGIKGHWDEELHGLDYLVYAYLQKGNNTSADSLRAYVETIDEVNPANFKVAYAFAAIPARIVLENKDWQHAATLQLHRNFSWEKFPWQEAIIHFAHLLGSVHTGNLPAAKDELNKLGQIRDVLKDFKDDYKANQVEIQIKAGQAWIDFTSGNRIEALNLMKTAADMEDSTAKHPVTPCEVLPARELYADMLQQLHRDREALQEFERVLDKNPKRFNSLYGAGSSAEKIGDTKKAIAYFNEMSLIVDSTCKRSEWLAARSFLMRRQ